MFNRIIVATDLSPASFAIAGCLGGLKALGTTHCLLLQCLDFQEATSTALSYSTAGLDESLERQRAILESQGFEVETRNVPGFAKSEINRVAAKEDYSLVVVGAHGRSMVGEALMGGVAYAVIHSARKPVLLLPLELKGADREVCVQPAGCDLRQHLLFPTDFSETADRAFTYVEGFASSGTRRITLLHVQDKVRIDPHLSHRLDEFNEIDRGRLEGLAARLRKAGTPDVDIELRYGSPFEEIRQVVQERNVHLVAMGSQGRGYMKELFLGSVSHNVARHAEVPLLLIPASR